MVKKDVKTSATVRPTDAMLRVSFLEQSAALLTRHSGGVGDAYNSLSKTYMQEMREIAYVEQLKLHRETKRSVCKKCQRLWVPDRSGGLALKLRKTGRKVLLTCGDCGETTAFVFNTKYRSRNEKN